MSNGYPEIVPYAEGMLDVGDGQQIYWTEGGNPAGKPVVMLHGGPGAPVTVVRRYLDPAAYRVVNLHQRGCGKSTPSAAEYETDLSVNTTHHLIADLEKLREHRGIERWMVFGASWGATLGFAYAEAHPERVTEIILFAVTNTSRREVEWITREMGRIFPQEWDAFVAGVPEAERDGNLAAAYARLLASPDPAVRERAALDWCTWEDVHVSLAPGWEPSLRYEDPAFRYLFARLVTHYWANAAWLKEGQLVRDAHRLHGIPGVLVCGQLDVSGPPDIAWTMAKAWPEAEFVLIRDAGHGPGKSSMSEVLVEAADRFKVR